MARTLFLMMPEAGHLTPTFRVAAFLRARGHRVSYLTVAPFSALLEQLGFETLALPAMPAASGTEDLWALRHSGDMIGREMEAQAINGGSSWPAVVLGQLEAARPDLVVCDASVADRVIDGSADCLAASIARRLGRPVVTISTSMPDNRPPPVPEIVLCPVEFDLPAERARPASRYYCEPSVWRTRPAIDLPARCLSRKRTVYCSLGTQSVNYADALKVLRAVAFAFDGLTSYQLLMSAGALYESIVMETLPPNVRVVRSAPQLDVLGRVDVVITHGGLGTLKEAIMARVPAVVIPFQFDQPANGRRVEFHGIGRACPPAACSSTWLQHAIVELADAAAVRERLADLSALFWARESECRAGQLLDQLA